MTLETKSTRARRWGEVWQRYGGRLLRHSRAIEASTLAKGPRFAGSQEHKGKQLGIRFRDCKVGFQVGINAEIW
jgi:hypothetical protein